VVQQRGNRALYFLWDLQSLAAPMTPCLEGKRTLHDELHQALGRDPHLARRDVRCEGQPGRVVLRGTVNSYYQKQMAQEIVRRLDRESVIDNQLEVCWS
jgi:osmotically-inducible protein OsmY